MGQGQEASAIHAHWQATVRGFSILQNFQRIKPCRDANIYADIECAKVHVELFCER